MAPLKNSGKNVTANSIYSGVEPCEELQNDNLTHAQVRFSFCSSVGSRSDSHSGSHKQLRRHRHDSSIRHLPEDAKETEGRLEKSTIFYWSDGIMLASYSKHKGKNVSIISSQHKEPLAAIGQHRNAIPEVMLLLLFYNNDTNRLRGEMALFILLSGVGYVLKRALLQKVSLSVNKCLLSMHAIHASDLSCLT